MTETEKDSRRDRTRSIHKPKPYEPSIGPLRHLPGTWANEPTLPGRGWNMIALPFTTDQSVPFPPPNFRLLLNQYNETLKFNLLDGPVPNRGIEIGTPTVDTDQFIMALDFEQTIVQIAAEDRPDSGGLAGGPALPIHHEPGLFLWMSNLTTDGLDVARVSTIPHGDSVLALGRSETTEGGPVIPAVSGLPIGAPPAPGYVAPYQDLFAGVLPTPVFDPKAPHLLLQQGLPVSETEIVRTTRLPFDTTLANGGILNIPFVIKQANAAEMKSIFWIVETSATNDAGEPRIFLQYLQTVLLDFFPRADGLPGRIRWPHISINTMEKVAAPSLTKSEAVNPQN